jgi:hypothetical protein
MERFTRRTLALPGLIEPELKESNNDGHGSRSRGKVVPVFQGDAVS